MGRFMIVIFICAFANRLSTSAHLNKALSVDQNRASRTLPDPHQTGQRLFTGHSQPSASLFAKPAKFRPPSISDGLDQNTVKQQKQQELSFKEKNDQGNTITSGKLINSQEIVAHGAGVIREVLSKGGQNQLRLIKKTAREDVPSKRQQADDDESCKEVCSFCKTVLSVRWAALCEKHCRVGGKAYDTCLAVWSFRKELTSAK